MKFLQVLILITALLFGAGCSFDREYIDLKEDALVVERDKKAKISGVNAYYENNQLVISGSVSKQNNSYGVHGGHIDVELLDENENVIASQDVKFIPMTIPRRGNRRSRFHAKFPMEFTNNLKVRLRYHRKGHIES